MALPEEVCHWGWAFDISKDPLTISNLLSAPSLEFEMRVLFLPPRFCSTTMGANLLDLEVQLNALFYVSLAMVFSITAVEKERKQMRMWVE